MIITFEKRIGETMGDAIKRCVAEHNLSGVKTCFANRLDPLASGIFTVLTGDDIHQFDTFCNMVKTYTYWVLAGITTDSYDLLGLITGSNLSFQENVFSESRDIMQPYPPFSSKSVNIDGTMVKLWDATKRGLVIKEYPTKQVTIMYNKHIDTQVVLNEELYEIIEHKIGLVDGNFRQKEILSKWKEVLNPRTGTGDRTYELHKYEIKMTSGGYVRSIAHGMNATAFDICRLSYHQTID